MAASMSPASPASQSIGKALGRLPSGLFVLTARHDGRSAAMLVSWVQQAGFDPPAVCCAIARERPLRPLIEAAGGFALSILGQSDSPLLKKYARGVPDGADPFEGVAVLQTPAGVPILADALAWLECRLTRALDIGGDHDLLVGEVTAGDLLKEGPPFTHVRGSGFHY